jgi:hypothetical protein
MTADVLLLKHAAAAATSAPSAGTCSDVLRCCNECRCGHLVCLTPSLLLLLQVVLLWVLVMLLLLHLVLLLQQLMPKIR